MDHVIARGAGPGPFRRITGASGALAAVALVAANFLTAAPAFAATSGYTVTDCSQYGAAGTSGTLGDALANLLAGGGTITFQCATTQSAWDIVAPTTIAVSSTLTLQNAAGAPSVILDGNKVVRVLLVNSGGNVAISGITVANGNAGSVGSGGDIYVSSGASLTLTGATISGGLAGHGGGGVGIGGGTVTVTNSTLSGNTAAYGGAIYAGATASNASITNSTISGNIAKYNNIAGNGGGIDLGGGSVTLALTGTTVSGNSGAYGGGLAVEGGKDVATITNSTVAANTANYGGGIYVNGSGSSAQISFTTSSGNSASVSGGGGGLNIGSGGSATLSSTLVAANTRGGACARAGTLADNGYNLADDSSCAFTSANHDVVTSAPKVGTLGLNGGPTQTVPLQVGSPAVDVGATANCPAADQRGVNRPQGGACDIGAYELQFPISTLTIGQPQSTSGSLTYVTSATSLVLSANDGTGPGIATQSYRVYLQGTTPPAYTVVSGSSTTISIPNDGDGAHEIDFYATDNNGTRGLTQTQFLALDNGAPAASLTIGQPQSNQGGTITVTGATPLTLAGTDLGSGMGSVSYRFYPQGGTPTSYTMVAGASASFMLYGYNTTYEVDYYATDKLGNQLAAQTQFIGLNNVATYTVTNCSQYGAAGVTGTLGDALATLQAPGATGGTITFSCGAPATIVFPAGVSVTTSLGLVVPTGAPAVTLDGNHTVRQFTVYGGGSLTLTNLTVANGYMGSAHAGGAIYVVANASLYLNNTTVSGSFAAAGGGGIDVAGGSAVLTNCTVSGNTAQYGGGIYVGGSGTTVTLIGTTVANNTANVSGVAGNGGGINVGGGSVTVILINSTVSGNNAAQGGGIFLGGLNDLLTLTGTSVSANLGSYGGGVEINSTGSTAQINGSTISGNTARYGASGGAVDIESGNATITNSTLSGNSAGNGGGIAVLGANSSATITGTTISGNSTNNIWGGGGVFVDHGGTAVIIDDTISGNAATGNGGGLYLGSVGGTATIRFTTITNNTTTDVNGAGGLFQDGTTVVIIDDTLIANNPTGGDCVGVLTDNGYNLADDSTCGFTSANHDVVTSTPGIGSLSANGGPTQTVPLLPGSPAIDAGNTSGCPATDQRGNARPDGQGCDIGAFES